MSEGFGLALFSDFVYTNGRKDMGGCMGTLPAAGHSLAVAAAAAAGSRCRALAAAVTVLST